jgi:hypothetical protein
MADITSANAQIFLTAPDVFPVAQRLQGFAADDIFDIDAIRTAETSMGVDGFLSAGFVFEQVNQTIVLQADSPSMFVMDQIYAYELILIGKEVLSATIKLPSLGVQYNIEKGFMTGYAPVSSARKIQQPRRFTFAWERCVPGPIVGV